MLVGPLAAAQIGLMNRKIFIDIYRYFEIFMDRPMSRHRAARRVPGAAEGAGGGDAHRCRVLRGASVPARRARRAPADERRAVP